jgi:hypothetical protein
MLFLVDHPVLAKQRPKESVKSLSPLKMAAMARKSDEYLMPRHFGLGEGASAQSF